MRPVLLVLLILGSSAIASTPKVDTRAPVVVKASAFAGSDRVDLSRSMWSSLHRSAAYPVREPFDNGGRIGGSSFAGDADAGLAAFSTTPMPPPSLSFDGIANLDNGLIYNLLILPPDMNGDVGPQHYVQIVNSLIRVYNTDTGAPMSPPFKISDIFAPLGTVCSTRNDGLPIVLYDALADRWLISQTCTAFPPFRQMVAVSKTGDPLGGYFVYEFVMPGVRLNDFPKFGIWPDGYYMSAEEYFGSDFVGSGAFAFDREKLLAGDASASYIYFRFPVPAAYRRSTLLPADMDGTTAPAAETPGIFAGYTATEYGDAQDAIRLFDFHADFQTPENSTFTERGESPIAVAAFDPTSPEGRPDIAQPPPGERLDSSSDRLNYRLAYRNFGTHQSLVFNQTVRASAIGDIYRAGVRVYELRRTDGAFAVHEQTTVGDAGSSRWVGSAAQDRMGDLAVQYNYVSDQKRVSDLYTGKLATDPPGVFRTEGKFIDGTGVQKAFGWRWGEYSGLSVDPLRDCDFWATNAYYSLESEEMSDFTWLTRIGKFRFTECVGTSIGKLNVRLTSSASGLALAGGVVRIYPDRDLDAYPFRRNTDIDGRLVSVPLPLNQYTVVASFPGYRSRSADATVVAGTPAQVDLALDPIPELSGEMSEVIAETCGLNHTPEPGETVTAAIGLRNSGALATTNLVAAVLPTGGIIRPSAPQNYGIVPSGGIITRPFTFTVAHSIECGSPVTLVLRLQDGSLSLGDARITLRSGETRTVLRENFDSVVPPALPEGWATSSTENHQLWRTATSRVQSAPNALFTPAPFQMGENEVISPPFSIATAAAEVSFRHWYELETTFLRNRLYDGSVLELRYGRGPWQDILAAGGSFASGGYDGTIDGCCQNPLAGRQGWSGKSGIDQASAYITTKVKMPPGAMGRTVQLRWRLGSDIGGLREGQYIDDLEVTDGYACSCAITPSRAPFDFDGDRKTDLAVLNFNDSDHPDLRFVRSSDGALRSAFWGLPGDDPSNADFDGDGKTDLAVFRSGAWYILPSSVNTPLIVNFGVAGDRVVPADYDGDGKADIAVYRESSGTWYVLRSSDGQLAAYQFGAPGDRPAAGDFDGDSKNDIAVYRPANGTWYIARTSDAGFTITNFGLSSDKPVPGDFDGDGRTDIAVYRPSTGIWYLLRSTEGFAAAAFGLPGDLPLQADFDGDGKADTAVYRPSTNVWWHVQSSDQQAAAREFGEAGDVPVPSIFVAP